MAATTHNPFAFGATLTTSAAALMGARRAAVTRAALAYKRTILAASPARLSRMGGPVGAATGARRARKGVRLNVGFDVRGQANPAALVKPRPAGAWVIESNGTRAHPIGDGSRTTRKGTRTRAKGRQVLAFAGGGLALGPVEHPATRGAHSWQHGVAAGTPVARREIAATELRAVVAAWPRG